MYARATAFRLKPEAQQEVMDHLREIRAQMETLDGLVQAYAMWNEQDGHGQTVALFESKEAADASEPLVRTIWQALAPHMQEAPMAVGYAHVEKVAG